MNHYINAESLRILLSDGEFDLDALKYRSINDEINLCKILLECPEIRESKRLTNNCLNYLQECINHLTDL